MSISFIVGAAHCKSRAVSTNCIFSSSYVERAQLEVEEIKKETQQRERETVARTGGCVSKNNDSTS